MARTKNIVIEDAKIIFRNFKGKGDKYNPEGRRTFGVLIDNEVAEDLAAEGWHIKYLRARDEDEAEQAYLPVRVSFKNAPPAIYLVTKHKKTQLTEELVGTLDNAEFETIDLTISPYHWSIEGKNGTEEGITAYLKSGYFTIVTDAFYDKYAKYDETGTKSTDDDEIPFGE